MELIIPTELTDSRSIERIGKDPDIPCGCDRPVVVYQHPLDTVNGGFERYCLENPDTVRGSKVLISLPTSYVEQEITALDESMERFVNTLNGLGFELEGKVGLIRNADVDKAFQRDIADLFDDPGEPDVYLTFFRISEFVQKSTLRKATAEILLGTVSIPVCLALFRLGILDWNTPRVFGIAFAMIGFAPLLLYHGAVNRKYQRWLRNRRRGWETREHGPQRLRDVADLRGRAPRTHRGSDHPRIRFTPASLLHLPGGRLLVHRLHHEGGLRQGRGDQETQMVRRQ